MAEVKLVGISKIYQGTEKAVNSVDINVRDKEFVVLVGPSGCGKSTTLRMIAGLEEVTEGELYIDDKRVNDVAPKNRDIAMVFQNYALYPHMTVYDNMAFGLKLRKYSKDEIKKRVDHAAAILGIEELLNRKPKELSGGQRQRVAVGRAIVRKPKVFLFDEPLSNLDAKLRVQMRTEISKLHQTLGATMIYVTHDQTEAMTMGDRIVIMKDGFIQQIDSPLNIYNNPVNKFVAGFIGSPAMNFVEGEIDNNGSLSFVSQNGDFKIDLGERYGHLKEFTGKKVSLGIRPENINDSAFNDGTIGIEVNVKLEVIEPMGNEMFIYFKLAGEQCIGRVSPDFKGNSGEEVKIFLDLKRIHFFDQTSGEAIQ
ncbi:MAG: sn-glycerol-3-phosphate ABC transporter ATP-binding protein UgpC [Ignavibacteriae bacterium]|nr:sn-glycerol-3-phosphate ABC transporter ATP-binding protein UgpC [Ignavibacteriota bacterium]NOG97755.1 sn-glycerol-3-phosphate ABC transporter ATP-binding protein UgpC [Ignavibacteriota bacterium]